MNRKALATSAAILALTASILVVPAQSQAAPAKVFITRCAESHVKQVDPIVAPGPTQMSAHMHEFFGNQTTDSDSSYQSMIDGATTCALSGDTAGYWVPTLLAPGGGSMVPAQSVNAYYRAVGKLTSQRIAAFPPDLRMVASRYFFSCGDTGSGTPLPGDCGSGSLHVSITFPACWDGARIDSADHISHMAYQTGRGCPSTHPVAVPRLVIVVRYIGVHDGTGYTLSSGPPSTMHADFWNTWDQPTLEGLVQRCFNAVTDRCGQVSG